MPKAMILLIVVLFVVEVSTIATASDANVNIYNDMEANQEPVVVGCASKERSLGIQTLAPGGKIGWGFTPYKLSPTIYTCNFGWGKHYAALKVWDDTYTWLYCTHCEFHMTRTWL